MKAIMAAVATKDLIEGKVSRAPFVSLLEFGRDALDIKWWCSFLRVPSP